MSAPASPDQFQEAVAYWRSRVPVTDEEFQQLTDDLKPLAFRVAAAAQADMVTQVYQALDSAIANGDSFDTFKDDIADRLGDSWTDDAPSLENTFRTNVMTAYSAGRYEIASDPDVRESHPMARYDVIEDGRTCEICEPLNAVVRPQEDWTGTTPPLHYQCRCILTPITEEDAQKEGIADKIPDTGVLDGFGNPERGQAWEPDVSAYPEDIQSILNRRLGDAE